MRYACFLFLILWCACKSKGGQKQGQNNALEQCYQLRSLTRPKHKAQPGEWRYRYQEIHEPLKAYTQRNPTAATAERTSLYVMQLGNFDDKGQQIFNQAKYYLSIFYQIPVKEISPVALELIAQQYKRKNTFGEQIYTRILLDSLLPSLLPDSAFALIAFTTADLYPDTAWNFVFGQASLEKRVGVWSMARLGDYNLSDTLYRKCLSRTLRVATHETGHMFGIKHCVHNECSMNGSNSLSESDKQPLWLCWECLAKVCWNRNIKPQSHLQALLQYHKQNLADTAAIHFYAAALKILGY